MSIQPRSLTDEEIKNLVKNAISKSDQFNTSEKLHLLELKVYESEYHHEYYKKYEVIRGRAKEVWLDKETVVLIPLTNLVIVVYTDSAPGYFEQKVYVHTSIQGWVEVKV